MAVNIRSVLVSDAVDPLCVDLLKNHGINVVCKYKLSKDQLIQELQAHDGLIVRSDTKVTKDIINSVPGLRVIGRAGTGVDNIDLDASTKKGIIVINTPGGNSISACEMTCALITSLARNVSQASQSLKEGRWDRKLYTGSELYGKTLAVLGLGRIGREVAHRMASYGMKIVGFDPIVSADDAKSFGVIKMELDEIWPIADYITVHTPLIPQTKNLVNEKTLNRSKKGVCIVNVARGGIIDEEALLAALQDGRCGGAALDVYVEEPPKNDITLALIKHPLVIATPHLGASTYEAQQRVAVEIGEQFIALSGRNKADENFIVNGAVNAPVLSATMSASNVPWITLAQQLGNVIGRLSHHIGSGTTVHLTSYGTELARSTFLNVPLSAGLLSTQIKSGVNLINAPAFAKDVGITVNFANKDGDPRLEVTLGNQTVTGTLGARGSSVLLEVNGAEFQPSGVTLGNNISIFEGVKGQFDLATLLVEVRQHGGDILSLATAAGKSNNYVLVQTADDLKPINIAGLTIC